MLRIRRLFFLLFVGCFSQLAGAGTLTLDIDPDAWWAAAELAGITSGGSVALDLYDASGASPVPGTDGVPDLTVTYNEYYTNGGGATPTPGLSSSALVGGNDMNHAASNAVFAEHSAINVQFVFGPGLQDVDASTITDLDMSSANGSTILYEYGMVELIADGALPQVTWSTLSTYNANQYGVDGSGPNALIHDQLFSGGAEGVAFYTGATNSTADQSSGTAGTGIGNGDQHFASDGVGPNYWNHYTSAPASGSFIDAISFWAGAVNVRQPATLTTTPSSSWGGGEAMATAVVPEPAGLFLMLIGSCWALARRFRPTSR